VVAALLLGALTSLMLLGGAQGTGYRDTGYWLLFFSVPGPLVYNSAPPTFGKGTLLWPASGLSSPPPALCRALRWA
jgi:hypothetical protein